MGCATMPAKVLMRFRYPYIKDCDCSYPVSDDSFVAEFPFFGLKIIIAINNPKGNGKYTGHCSSFPRTVKAKSVHIPTANTIWALTIHKLALTPKRSIQICEIIIF